MRLQTILNLPVVGAFLFLSACASSSLRPTILPPIELMADCPSGEETTIGDALDNRWKVIQCEWSKNQRLRAWALDAVE